MSNLRQLRHPDLSEYLVHFTGRPRTRPSLAEGIRSLPPEARLEQILRERLIRAFETYFATVPVVCFTESTLNGLSYMIDQESYSPWGLVFHRQTVFDRGGGPVFYLRDDEWSHRELLPDTVKSRIVKLAPGSSEWVWEREWRIPYQAAEGFAFAPEEVVALVVGEPYWPPPVPSLEMVYRDGDFEAAEVPGRPTWLPHCERWLWDPTGGSFLSVP